MEATQEGQEITLKHEVRTLTRPNPQFNILSHADTRWLRAGEAVRVSEEKFMSYDHRDHLAVRILDCEPERYILVAELEQNLPHLKSKPPKHTWLNAEKLLVKYEEKKGVDLTADKSLYRAYIRFTAGPHGCLLTEWFMGQQGAEIVVTNLAKVLGVEVVEEK